MRMGIKTNIELRPLGEKNSYGEVEERNPRKRKATITVEYNGSRLGE